jgi:putative ABC transport system permease protein
VRFTTLIVRNVGAKRVRSGLTALAIAIGVTAGITIGLVTSSLRSTAVSILRIGSADFSVTQKGVSDVLDSILDEGDLERMQTDPAVDSVLGVLVATEDLDADNPLFLEIGVPPDRLEEFGVRIVEGRAYGALADDEVMLGYRAARNLRLGVGDMLRIEGERTVVGIYATGQEFGDSGSMFPLVSLQASERKSGDVTIAFVRLRPGADIDAVRRRIENENPQLITVRTAEEFGRADRNLQLISAADRGATIVALAVGALIVANAMMLSFFERTREFGVLRSIGWSRRRVALLVVGEALCISLIGAAVGVSLSVLATRVLEEVSGLRGVFHPRYTAGTFGRGLFIAAGTAFVGALYPALRAAFLAPLEALRRE